MFSLRIPFLVDKAAWFTGGKRKVHRSLSTIIYTLELCKYLYGRKALKIHLVPLKYLCDVSKKKMRNN